MFISRSIWLSVALATLMAATSASAVSYQLRDHGYGNQGPAYGLRVDSVGEIFSVELGSANVILDWDGGATATISGTLNQNTLGGAGGVGPTWTVNYILTGVTPSGGGFVATGGNGVLTDPFAVDTVMTGIANGSGYAFEFLDDGHRIPGDGTSFVGRGWLAPPSSTDDWLVQVVPEPGTGLLLGLGLAALGASRKR